MILLLHPRVDKFIEKLPVGAQLQLRKRLQLIKKNPTRYLERLVGKNYYKLRLGKYRAIVDVTDSKAEMLVIRHRRNAYD